MRPNRGRPCRTGPSRGCRAAGGSHSPSAFRWVVRPSHLWHHATTAWSRIGEYAGLRVASGEVMVADTTGSVQFSIGRVIGDSIGIYARNFVGFTVLALL